MKKYLFAISAALLSLAACNKEIVIDNPVNNNAQTAVLTFTSARPQLDADTKTSWDGSAIVWTAAEDKIKVGFTFDGDWWGQDAAYSSSAASPNNHKKFYQSDAVDIDATDASVGTFSVPATFTGPSDNGDFVFYAVYPSTAMSDNSQDGAPTVSVTLKSTQTPLSNSFDGSADLMVGKSDEITSTGLPSDPIDLNWTRVVAHGLFTLKDFQGVTNGETITKVVFTAQDGANLTGKQSVNIADGTVTASDASKVITLDGTNLAFVTEEGKTNLKVWLSVVPATLTSLNVVVETNKATYVRDITSISKTLKGNACNKLGINMHDVARTPKAEYDWVKKNLSEITSSDIFVIVGNNGSNYAMSNDNGTTNPPSAVAVNVSNNKLASAPADRLQWNLTVSDGSYTFYPNGTTETWLYCTATNNGVRVGTNDNKAFTLDESGYLKNTGTSRYVGVYSGQDWRCYTSSTATNIKDQTFSFYVRSEATPSKPVPTISFGAPTTEVNIGETVTNAATISESGLTVTYESDDEDIATVDATGKVTGVAVGTATITASFAGNDSFDAASASYDITVVDPNANDGSASKPYTASEAAALALGGSTASNMYVKGIISSIAIAYNSSNNSISFYISDDGLTSSTQFEIYRTSATSADDYKVGDAVVFKGTFTKYNSTPEFAAGSTLISQLHAPSFSPADGNFSTATLSVTITADSGTQIRYTTDGTNPTATTGTVYSSAISINATTTIKAIAVKDGVVTGVVSKTYTKVSSVSVTANFIFNTDAGISALGISKPASGAGTSLAATYTVDNVVMDVTHGSTDTRVWNSNGTLDLRIYKGGGSLTFSVPSGKNIKTIAITGGAVGVFSASTGTYSNGTWTGSANSVKLTATGTGKINTIAVTYE